jgi:PAS domain S-box-containing protein
MRESARAMKRLQAVVGLVTQERARTDAVFASIGEGAITTDENGKIRRINQMAMDMLGYAETELVGKWFPRKIIALDKHGKEVEPLDRPITKAFLTGHPINERTYYRRKDGTSIPVGVTVSPILLRGRPIGAVEVFRDISHELEVDRMKSEFISLASHQLRTPLSAINTYAHMLHDGYAGDISDQQREIIETILTSAERMNELISVLLNVTRIEAGAVSVRPEKTNLEVLLKQIIQELKHKAADKQIIIQLNLPKNPIELVTDPLLTKEVYVTLLTNAIKYTPQSGTIEVSLYQDGDNITFEVSDNGYGIPVDAQKRIFSKFFRGSNILDKDTGGTGLGLYLAKEIVEDLGGDIWFTSKEQVGTTFYFALPKEGVKVAPLDARSER